MLLLAGLHARLAPPEGILTHMNKGSVLASSHREIKKSAIRGDLHQSLELPNSQAQSSPRARSKSTGLQDRAPRLRDSEKATADS